MQFTLTEDQRHLEESVERFVREHYSAEAWRSAAREAPGFREALWSAMAEMGWLAACIPEAYGGLGLGGRERAIIMQGVGSGVVLEPYWSTAVAAVELVLAAGTEAQKRGWLPKIADGSLRMAAALLESHAGYDWADTRCRAERSAGSWLLSGRKIAVLDAPGAHCLLVLARTGDGRGDLALFRVEAGASGVTRRDARTLDERHVSDIDFKGVRLDATQHLPLEGGLPALQGAIDACLVAIGSECVGAATALLDATIQYLKTRRQFGKPLSEFQALRHRVADMLMATEQARSLTLFAAGEQSGGGPLAAGRRAAAVKVVAGQSGRFVAESAVQLHGGIGVTDELQIGHYLKRMLVADYLLGDSTHHLKRLAASDPEFLAQVATVA